jgi:hypothetical protein
MPAAPTNARDQRERSTVAGVDVRHRHQHQQHDAHVVYLAAAGARRGRVAEFVQGLDQREDEPEQQQVVAVENPVRQVVGELGPALWQQHQRRHHDQQPQQRTGHAPHTRPPRGEPVEERPRVNQRDPHRHRVRPGAPALRARLALAALEDLERIRRHVGLQQVGAVQLAEQLQDLVLGRRIVAEPALRELPQVVHAAPAVHRREDQARGRRETVHLARCGVLQQIPEFAAVAMAVQSGTRQQPGPQRRHAVPQAALQRGVGAHREPLRASSSTRSAAATR